MLLVGDDAYYRRSGFVPVPEGRIAFPGPVDPARVMICELVEGAFEDVAGPLRRAV